ncbi:MAG: monovalent cation/H(+) antiporter subunit G [Bacteroidetes bacterium]|nr:monovalent cation/H(+) antiporter subunit G [Bacteroidota bacterium]
MTDLLIAAAALIGSLFALIAAIGVVRMPDLFLRTAAATKAATFGLGIIMLAVALSFEKLDVTTTAIAVVAFVALTAPVAAHMITRAAYMRGVPLWDKTITDELRAHVDTGHDQTILPSTPGEPGSPAPRDA